jgi:hypothetical protein
VPNPTNWASHAAIPGSADGEFRLHGITLDYLGLPWIAAAVPGETVVCVKFTHLDEQPDIGGVFAQNNIQCLYPP